MIVLVGIPFVILMCALLVIGVFLTLFIGGISLAWFGAKCEQLRTRISLKPNTAPPSA
jgi:hypothetical protein